MSTIKWQKSEMIALMKNASAMRDKINQVETKEEFYQVLEEYFAEN